MYLIVLIMGSHLFLLLDDHGSRFELPFLECTNNEAHKLKVCISDPYGTSYYQVGDCTEQNGCFKMALAKATWEPVDKKNRRASWNIWEHRYYRTSKFWLGRIICKGDIQSESNCRAWALCLVRRLICLPGIMRHVIVEIRQPQCSQQNHLSLKHFYLLTMMTVKHHFSMQCHLKIIWVLILMRRLQHYSCLS